MQDMQADQAAVKIPIFRSLAADGFVVRHFVIEIRYSSVPVSRQDDYRYFRRRLKVVGINAGLSLKPPFRQHCQFTRFLLSLRTRSPSNVRNRP